MLDATTPQKCKLVTIGFGALAIVSTYLYEILIGKIFN
jgi:hypothetical protein